MARTDRRHGAKGAGGFPMLRSRGALSIACPLEACGAGPGQSCRSLRPTTRKVRRTSHPARTAAWNGGAPS